MSLAGSLAGVPVEITADDAVPAWSLGPLAAVRVLHYKAARSGDTAFQSLDGNSGVLVLKNRGTAASADMEPDDAESLMTLSDTDGPNGKPCITIPADADAILSAAVSVAANTRLGIYAVLKVPADSAPLFLGADGSDAAFAVYDDAGNVSIDSTLSGPTANVLVAHAVDDAWHIYAEQTLAGGLDAELDGVDLTGEAGTTGVVASNIVKLMGAAGGAAAFAELLVFTAPDAAQRTRVLAYLDHEWGLP